MSGTMNMHKHQQKATSMVNMGRVRNYCGYMGIYYVCPLINNQAEEDEMGGPCSTNGGEEERV
jgi:hypothetical protein